MRRFVVLVCCVLAGCSWIPTWGVYKIDINQGNFITQDAIEKLKVGQTKAQVRLLLGTPLVADAFHSDRWDFVYRFESAGRVLEDHKFMVEFKDDKLTRWTTAELPVSPIRGYAGERKEGVTKTIADDSGWWRKIRDFMGW